MGSGDLRTGRNIYVDARVNVLKQGTTHQVINHGPVNPGQSLSLAAADIYHGQGTGARGARYLSHFMQASWTSNNDQWIGPAYEIEGGTGSTTSPPETDPPQDDTPAPAPAPSSPLPDAPVLLP
jgi:hypothetical protein